MRLKTTLFFLLFVCFKSVELGAQTAGAADFSRITTHLQTNFPNVDFNEKLILVSFWSSDNLQSRADNRELMSVYTIYKAALLKNGKKGVVFYTISADKNKLQWELACKKDNISNGAVNFCDEQGMNSALIKELNIHDLPHNILFDSNGKVIAVDMKTQDGIFNTFVQQITR